MAKTTAASATAAMQDVRSERSFCLPAVGTVAEGFGGRVGSGDLIMRTLRADGSIYETRYDSHFSRTERARNGAPHIRAPHPRDAAVTWRLWSWCRSGELPG